MKYTLILILFLAPVAYGQCVGDAQCVPQATIDRCARAADELAAARIAITKLEATTNADALAIKSAQTAIASLEKAIETGKTIQAHYESVIGMYKDALKTAFEIIDRQSKAMGKGKSAWGKFVDAIKAVAYILAGAALRGNL